MLFLRQPEKPDWHSLIILLSHLGYVVCAYISFQFGLSLESVTFSIATTISLLYHLCDEEIICIGNSDCSLFNFLI